MTSAVPDESTENFRATAVKSGSVPRREPNIFAAGPSLLRYAPTFVLLAIAIADAGRVADTDLWGHIAFGHLFLRHGPVSRDPFSYSAPGHLWAVHEWLAEVMMARTWDLFGIAGLMFWKFACTSLTVLMLAMIIAETGAAPPLQAAVLVTLALALLPMMQFRPQLYSYMFLAALIALLTRENYRRRARLWLAIPMLALWANLHGGFVVGVAVLVIYSGAVMFQGLINRGGVRRATRLAAITIGGALATLANPYGLNAWAHVLAAAGNPETRKDMVDWQPMMKVLANSHGLHSGVIFFGLVATILMVLAIAFVLTPRGGDLALVAVAAVLGAAAFNVVRNMPLAVIAAAAPLARHLDLLGKKIAARSASPGVAPRHASTAGQVVITVAALILMFGRGGLLSLRIPAAIDYPAGAIFFMRAHDLHGNVLARFEWGQYVIFYLAPSSRIFVDGRIDLAYPPVVVHEYIAFFTGQRDGDSVLDTYPNDFVLMPPESAAYQTMLSRSDWKLIYSDEKCALFAHANSPAAALDGVPVNGHASESYFP